MGARTLCSFRVERSSDRIARSLAPAPTIHATTRAKGSALSGREQGQAARCPCPTIREIWGRLPSKHAAPYPPHLGRELTPATRRSRSPAGTLCPPLLSGARQRISRPPPGGSSGSGSAVPGVAPAAAPTELLVEFGTNQTETEVRGPPDAPTLQPNSRQLPTSSHRACAVKTAGATTSL